MVAETTRRRQQWQQQLHRMAPAKSVLAGFALFHALPSAALVHEAFGADSIDGSGVGRRAFLASTSALRPEFVAQLLTQVEDEWKNEAGKFVSCNRTMGNDAPCFAARKAFDGSCFKVVGAVLGGSGGDKERSTEYLGDICRQPSLQGWKRDKCNSFAHDMLAAMSENSFSNRNFFNPSSVCSGLWSNFAAEEKLLLAEAEQAKAREHLEAARKAEVARVKAEQERVEAAKKAKEEALKAAIKAAAERKNKELQEQRMAEEAKIKAETAARERAEEERQKEVRRKEEEAVRQAEEAKKAAEQASARLKAKKEEAAKEEAAEAAARKAAEAAALKIHQLKALKVAPTKSPRKVQTLGAANHTEAIKNVTIVKKASKLSTVVHK
mmetsp:Transcript_108414/g.215289  ORF Transcript_108414/g.215289 Transcript_108414/m.215289 type:complete len:382 (+) Transcript_108414:185-1330(+)